MSDCGCHGEELVYAQRRTIVTALLLNVGMFGVGGVAGLLAGSTALLADALDMLADAFAYGISLYAIGRSVLVKKRAALTSGIVLGILSLGVIFEAVRRALGNEAPQSVVMLGTASLSLIVNTTVLRMLARYREGEVHLRASWLFTRADVIANIGVILASLVVMATHSGIPDVIAGLAIGAYVLREALEIGRSALAVRTIEMQR